MEKLANKVFQGIHQNNLIYNTCWEDPRCDRQLLNLKPDSEVVMITSAGCNALDYALDTPSVIHCVDMNPRQNALLDLKLATFQNGSHEDLYQLFGEGVHRKGYDFYRESLRPILPDYAQGYWDKNINFFLGKGVRKTFYHHGTSGLFAWIFTKYLKFQKKNYKLATQLFEAQSMSEQHDLYFHLEKKVLNNFVKWLMSRHLVMCMLGVPKSQHNLFAGNNEGVGFIQNSLRHVFTSLPITDNYFWQLYFKGQYSPDCVPNYLQKNHFNLIQKQGPLSIQTHTNTLTGFLKQNPHAYSHYVLLDHQDWLAANNRPALEEEWRTILENSQRGTRILLRSAAYEVDFFPHFVKTAVDFEKDLTLRTHAQDRVGTYGSVYLGIVK
jgi:S-adenosylmethionine-diacylglycerol 3-amino-3-carboxypropyl transferase